MTKLDRFERAAEQDVKRLLAREVAPLAIIVVVAVVLQQLTHYLSQRNA